MYFYIISSGWSAGQLAAVKKLGITQRPPKCRLAEYQTYDITVRYHVVVHFPSIIYSQLQQIEGKCLSATREYNHLIKQYPNNESRYNISEEELFIICSNYFPTNYTIYTHDDAIKLSGAHISDTPLSPMTYQQLLSIMPIVLRGYQLLAYNQLINILQIQRCAVLNILCRCGKTEIFKRYIFDHQHIYKYIIYVAPRLTLIAEMYKRFDQLLDRRYIALSSGKLPINITDEQFTQVINDDLMIFVCIDSFNRLHPLLEKKSSLLIVFDEAHYLCTKANDNPVTSIKDLPYVKAIYSTATPVFGNYLTSDYIYLNDYRIFGKWSNAVTFNDISVAIEQKFISPMKIVVQTTGKSNRIINSMELLQTICTESPRKKILLYCNSINSVVETYNTITSNYKQFTPFKLVSNMSALEQANVIPAFTACPTPSILVNCQMVTDGINILDLDTVVYVDLRYQKQHVIQSCMRPRNYVKDKTAYCIIPHVTGDDYTTVLTIIRELHQLNDPVVVKQISNANSMKLANVSGQSVVKPHELLDDIIGYYIDNNTHANLTTEQVIMRVMRDLLPRTLSDIISECAKLIANDIKDTLNQLVASGVICKDSLMYYMVKPKQSTLADFYKRLRDAGCYDELTYIRMFKTTDWFIVDPASEYKDFSYDELDNRPTIYYTIDECRVAIDQLLLLHSDAITSTVSPAERLNIMRTYDKKIIPYDKLSISLSRLHSVFGSGTINKRIFTKH